ncbi:MAG: phosphopantetheine-binding protein [Chloroflexota bacterium]
MTVTAAQIKEIIVNDVDPQIDVESLKEDLPLTGQGIDSLDMYTLFLSIEEGLGVAIPDEDVEKLNTIDDIVKYVSLG